MNLFTGVNLHSPNGTPSFFVQYFRCPATFSSFESADDLSLDPGFFLFDESVCYGRASGAPSPTWAVNLPNVTSAVRITGNKAYLPFNAQEVIDNLRLETYASVGHTERLLRSLYYLVRSGLPPALRKWMHRSVSRERLHGFPAWPVDLSVELIFASLMKLALDAAGLQEMPFIWFWPNGYRSALMMTHDVEQQIGATHCDMLMDLDDSFGIRSSFQIVPESRYTGTEELIHAVRARGFEVNLHDLDHDGRLYEDESRFQRRARKINSYAQMYRMKGFRAGSMHRNQRWFHLLDFEYDMSVPNVAHLEPQRGGCCTVMPYFVGGLLELPLTTVQDHGLFYILREHSIDFWKQQIDTIYAKGGLISFIVHPDYLIGEKERSVYRSLLQYITGLQTERNIWLALPSEVNDWWRQRAQMSLKSVNGSWHIEGQGNERATIAYARLLNGKLVIQLEHDAFCFSPRPAKDS